MPDAGVGEALAADALFAGGADVAAGAVGGDIVGGAVAGDIAGGALGAGAVDAVLPETVVTAGALDGAAGLGAGEAAGLAGAAGVAAGTAGAGGDGGGGGGTDALSGASSASALADPTAGIGDLGFGDFPGSTVSFPSGGGGSAIGGDPLADPTADIGDTSALTGDYGSSSDLKDAVQNISRSKTVKDALDKLTKYGPLALGGIGALGQRATNARNAKAIGALGGPQRDIGNQLISQFQSGSLSPADAARISQWEQGAIAAARQFNARAGTSNSTQANTSEATIRAQAEQMRQQALQSLLTTGLNTLNVTDQYQAAAIQAEMRGDQQMAQNGMSFLNAYGSWLRAVPQITGEKAA